MAEANWAPSERVAESRLTRDWASLMAGVPYYGIVVLGVIGVFWTTLFRAPATYLLNVSDVRGLVNSDAMGRMMLTLLALGVFVSGLNLRAWKLCVAGAFLAVAAPLLAWFQQAAWVLLLIGGVLIALGLLLWWGRARQSHDRD